MDRQGAGESHDAAVVEIPYPRKYWWVAVLVALVVAAIPVLPHFFSRDGGSDASPGTVTIAQDGSGNIAQTGAINISGSDLSTRMYVFNVPELTEAYQEQTGANLSPELRKRLTDVAVLTENGDHAAAAEALEALAAETSLPALYNNLAVEYTRAGNTAAAQSALQRALVNDPDLAPANLNRALIELSAGKLNDALPRLEKAAGSMSEAKALRDSVQTELQRETRSVELEPNDDLFSVNVITLEAAIPGSIAQQGDNDCFQFTVPPVHRDHVLVRVENRSTTLQPHVWLYDRNKNQFTYNFTYTPGANVELSFVAAPEELYYVRVGGHDGTAGDYRINVRPLRRYDAHEPNQDVLHATTISVHEPAIANIMDSGDSDFFRLRSGAEVAQVVCAVENRSATLQPHIVLFDANKAQLDYTFTYTSGANLTLEHAITPQSDFYVQIYGHDGTVGDYQLTVRTE